MQTEITQELLDRMRSDEEKQFCFWLGEAIRNGLIEWFEYEPFQLRLFEARKSKEMVQLKTKQVERIRQIHGKESYTPDFELAFTPLGRRVLRHAFRKAMMVSDEGLFGTNILVDVKGGHNPYQNDERYFSIVRKAVCEKHGVWVEKIIPWQTHKTGDPTGLFMITWVPEELRWKKNRKEPELTVKGKWCDSVDGFMVKQKPLGEVKVQEELF